MKSLEIVHLRHLWNASKWRMMFGKGIAMNGNRRKPNILKITLLLLLVITLAVIGLFYDSGHRIVTNQVTIESETLPAAFDGFRIVELTDLHGAEFGESNARLVENVRSCNPDLIALTGDFVENAEQMQVTLTLARALTGIAPVYYVTGNHEWASGLAEELMAALESEGVRCMRNQFEILERDGAQMLLIGVEDPNSYADLETPDRVVSEAQAVYPGLWTLLLAHRNYWVEEYPTLPVDLILCGHSHGGVVRLPFIGGLMNEDRSLFPEYDAGIYDGERFRMFVSAGLGQNRYFPRLLNNPEIACVTLKAVD